MPTRRARNSPAAPVIEPLRLMNLEDVGADALQPDARVDGLRITGADLSERDLRGLVTDECELISVTAHRTDLTSARLLETRVERLDAPVLTASRATLRDVELAGSRIGAFDAFDTGIEAVHVSSTKFGWVNLRGAELTNVLFEDCSFDELDLTEATATRVAFHDCRAESVAFAHARLKDVDLRGLELSSLSNLDGMRGATVSTQQATMLAADFAAHLGIRIAD